MLATGRVDDLVVDTDAPPEELTRRLAEEGHHVSTLVPVRADPESVFLELTASSTLGHGSDAGLVAGARTGRGPDEAAGVEQTRLRWRRAVLAVSIGGSLLIAALPIEDNGPWLLHNNVLGIVQNGYPCYDCSAEACFDYLGGEGCQPELSLAEGVRSSVSCSWSGSRSASRASSGATYREVAAAIRGGLRHRRRVRRRDTSPHQP